MPQLHIFLSTVSAEFKSYRETLHHWLTRPNVVVAVQEDFIATGTETLDLLDRYIQQCDAVIHLVGDMTGAPALAPSLAVIRERYPDFGLRFPMLAPLLQDAPAGGAAGPALSYTQWEAWLALYHGKRLLIAAPEPGAPRDARHAPSAAQTAAQQAHLQHLASVERYPAFHFRSADHLAAELLRSTLHDMLVAAGVREALAGRPQPNNLPYRPSPYFTGRDALLAGIDTGLSRTRVVALSGMGGIGKTRLAVEYAWQRAGRPPAAHTTPNTATATANADTAQPPALLFVQADSPEALHRNLAALCSARVLDLPEQHLTDLSQQAEAVLRWLGGHGNWLLVLDNLDTEAAAQAAEALLPRLHTGLTLLTTRLSHWSPAVTVKNVSVLSPEAARDFLLARTQGKRRPEPDADADATTGMTADADARAALTLARELGELPLALEQAGAYIAHRRQRFSQYLSLWTQQRDQLLSWWDERLMNYPRSVAVTWRTSYDQIRPAAQTLLQRLAWYSDAPLPESLLDVPVPQPDDAAAPSVEPWDALSELAAYSLVTRAAEAPQFSVHRLVQEVTRGWQGTGPAPPALDEALQWMNAAFVGSPEDVRTWPVLEPLAPHAQAVVGFADERGIADPTSRLLNELGQLWDAKADYAQAEPLMRRALAIDEASFGPHHPDVAIRLNNLAQLLQATNRLDEAEPLMHRALAIDEASFGPHHPDVAIALNNLALLLQATNRLDEAEPLMRRALAIDDASFGTDHPRVAIDLNNLARLLHDTSRLDEAEPLMRRALAIDEASFGPDHPRVAIDVNNLALLLQATNRLDEAEPLMRRALAIDEASFGPHHPKVAIRLNNLARLLQDTNRLDEAEPLMRRALSIDEASFGPHHPRVGTQLNNLAGLLQDTNRLDEAEPLMRRALTIDEASFGPHHPNVAIDLNNLARLLHDTNRLDEAEPLMRRALVVDEATFGPDHPKVAIRLNNLARLLHDTNRLDEAEPLMRRAVDIFTTSLGPDHPSTRTVQANLDALLAQMRAQRPPPEPQP